MELNVKSFGLFSLEMLILKSFGLFSLELLIC